MSTVTPTSDTEVTDQPTPEMVDVNEIFGDELRSMPVKVSHTTSGQAVETVEHSEASHYREAAFLRIQVHHGARAILILLLEGATTDDLEYMRHLAEELRRGRLGAGWRRITPTWADERTYTYAFTLRPVSSDAAPSPAVIRCDQPQCREAWHGAFDRHHADGISKTLPNGAGSYSIDIYRDVIEEDGRGWYLDVFTDEFFGTSDDVASFVSDLQWMQAACRRANDSSGGAQ